VRDRERERERSIESEEERRRGQEKSERDRERETCERGQEDSRGPQLDDKETSKLVFFSLFTK
jgi:hypothetical protein